MATIKIVFFNESLLNIHWPLLIPLLYHQITIPKHLLANIKYFQH